MWVDSLDHSGWGMLTEVRDEDQETPDPLVMLAWKCKHLEHLTLFGKENLPCLLNLLFCLYTLSYSYFLTS